MSLVCRSCRFFQVVARCVQRQVTSTAAAHQQGRHLPFRGAEAYPHDHAVQRTIEIPLLPYMWWFMSLFTGRGFSPVVVQRQIPVVLLLQTIVSPRCTWTRCSTSLLAGGESPTGAVVVKSVVLPQLHLS